LNVDVAPFLLSVRGDKPDVAVAGAKTVIAVETGLAKAAMDRTERRDPKKRDHTMQATEIAAVAPGFQLTQYFAEIGAPKFASLNVGNPGFFKTVNEQFGQFRGTNGPITRGRRSSKVCLQTVASNWLGRNRRFSNDYKYAVQTSQAMRDIPTIRVMLNRLAPA
jgi:predicted metalloendopeptidase